MKIKLRVLNVQPGVGSTDDAPRRITCQHAIVLCEQPFRFTFGLDLPLDLTVAEGDECTLTVGR